MDVNITYKGTQGGQEPRALAMDFVISDNACGEMTMGEKMWVKKETREVFVFPVILFLWRPDWMVRRETGTQLNEHTNIS